MHAHLPNWLSFLIGRLFHLTLFRLLFRCHYLFRLLRRLTILSCLAIQAFGSRRSFAHICLLALSPISVYMPLLVSSLFSPIHTQSSILRSLSTVDLYTFLFITSKWGRSHFESIVYLAMAQSLHVERSRVTESDTLRGIPSNNFNPIHCAFSSTPARPRSALRNRPKFPVAFPGRGLIQSDETAPYMAVHLE